MNLGRLLARNLRFHWRGNLAVFLGVVVGAAVLTGALLVGDSLRGSLRDRALARLGWVDHALITGRFFRADVASSLADGACAPALLLQGSATTEAENDKTLRRAGRVVILGVDPRFRWETPEPPGGAAFWESAEKEVVLSANLADELQARPGDSVALHMQKASVVPRESLLGRRNADDVLTKLTLRVRAVIPALDFGSQFSLTPSPTAPRNAFVPLRTLQESLDLAGKANALFVHGAAPNLDGALRLDDWGLTLQTPESRTASLFAALDKNGDGNLSRAEWRNKIAADLARRANNDGMLARATVREYFQQRGTFSLESRQMVLEPAVANVALEVAKEMNLTAAPTLVYLANRIGMGDLGDDIPYSIVAALDPTLAAPLGPFLPEWVKSLKDDEIILADWKESPLAGRNGAEIKLTYFQPEQEGKLEQRSANFRLRGLLPMTGVAADPDITPEFPGITDKLTLTDWNPPFPYDNKRVKKRDENYWNTYRTTPKAYITLAAGQKLWGSRFGELTSIRLAPPAGADLEKTAAEFRAKLLAKLRPAQGGFVFDAVRAHALAASVGGTPFGLLFLGFSVFLIAAALLLVGLLFRLNLERRAAEIGLLLALGYRPWTVRWLLLAEGGAVALAGALMGGIGALLYAAAMLAFLRAYWPGDLDRSFLQLYATPASLAIGVGAALVVSLLTIAWALRVLSRVSPSALINGTTTVAGEEKAATAPRWGQRIALVCLIVGVILIATGGFVKDHEARAGTFFGGGALLLTAGLAGAWVVLKNAGRQGASARPALATLGARNAGRNPVRSLLTAGLLASAAFLVVAVESFRRQPDADFLAKNSGSGGFSLLGESDVPLFQDLNAGAGRVEIVEALKDRSLSAAPLDGVTFYPFRVIAGDDASCLNLYQPGRPRLFGAPRSLIDRGGFHFADTLAETPEEKANPWLLLDKPDADGAIPVFGESNTVQWMLHKGLKDIVEVPDERGRATKLRIVGLLQDSVFQGELLMSEAHFARLYPTREGFSFFLIDAPPDRIESVKGLLDTALASQGFEATSSARRLQAYLEVENTYLSTFQLLGGLGLLLGALGLAVVLLRGVWERRGELALLRALGFRRQALGWMVLAENALLLVLGIGIGTGAALAAVAPHTIGSGAALPWPRLLGLLGLVVVVGLTAGAAALAATLRAPLLPALRRE